MDVAGHLLERRSQLAPLVGQRVRVRGVVMKGGALWMVNQRRVATLLGFVRVEECNWQQCGHHLWLKDRDLVREVLASPGDLIEFTATVDRYRSTDPSSGNPVTRYGLGEAESVHRVGRALLGEMMAELVRIYGWEAVADAVAGLHGSA